jgi:hypothetical protein
MGSAVPNPEIDIYTEGDNAVFIGSHWLWLLVCFFIFNIYSF